MRCRLFICIYILPDMTQPTGHTFALVIPETVIDGKFAFLPDEAWSTQTHRPVNNVHAHSPIMTPMPRLATGVDDDVTRLTAIPIWACADEDVVMVDARRVMEARVAQTVTCDEVEDVTNHLFAWFAHILFKELYC